MGLLAHPLGVGLFTCASSQLGHGDRNNLGLPRKLEALEGVKIVTGAAGGAHTLLVDGSLLLQLLFSLAVACHT